jgi:hypothetical protein
MTRVVGMLQRARLITVSPVGPGCYDLAGGKG